MRLGITISFMDKAGKLKTAAEFAQRARDIEDAGFDAAYMGHRLPGPSYVLSDRYDPLSPLLVAAMATERIELGTCVLIAGPLNKYDLFQRLYTLESMAPGRYCIGVGTGSGKGYYDAVGLDWDGRYKRLADQMSTIRAMFDGGEIDDPVAADARQTPVRGETYRQRAAATAAEPTAYSQKGSRPKFVLGSWHSAPQLKIAAREYDGWMASAGAGARFGGWRTTLSEAIKVYRDLGGTRAMVASVSIDLNADAGALGDEGPFSLQCPPSQAADRLGELAALGYDDVILNRADRYTTLGPEGFRYDSTPEELAAIRALLPRESD